MAPIARPKAQKPSKVVKPKKNTKRTTVTHKSHRFQPFSERVANLKIDPIRRRRTVEEQDGLSGETETHFGRALEEWQDLNMSKTFTDFAKEAAPLCEGLPALLYSEGKMMDVLALYIQKEDALAMEPLLSLLSSFARDLDARFEKHFQRAVSTVAAVAAKHQDPAVVEWSFTSLAWLFKYLSRLLIPDLRPLYDLMAPYLGKQPQKPFIIRFAAESLSFLVRKAAAAHERDPKPLRQIVEHMLADCESASDLLGQGVMTLLTEAMRGVQSALHSGGLAILRCVLDAMTQTDSAARRTVTLDIAIGVITSIIHNTNADTFSPVQDTILAYCKSSGPPGDSHLVDLRARLLFTIVSVRKGTRVSAWGTIMSTLRKMAEPSSTDDTMDYQTRASLLAAIAVTLQYATIDAVLPNLAILDTLRTGGWAATFLRFCDFFARLGAERFQQFLLPQFQKFVLEHADWNNEAEILAWLPVLLTNEEHAQINCPQSLQTYVVRQISDLRLSNVNGPQDLSHASLALQALPHLKIAPDQLVKVLTSMETVLRLELSNAEGSTALAQAFALGTCFSSYLELTEDPTPIADLWQKLCTRSPDVAGLPLYWKNLLRYLKCCPPSDLDGAHIEQLESTLLQCMSMPSHEIRQAALDVIELLYRSRDRAVPAALSTAITIESTPISFETSRRISMDIRRLSQEYSSQHLDPFVQKVIPSYCFGLLHVQLTQAWDEASKVLAEIAKNASGEDVIVNLAQTWLSGSASDYEQGEATDRPPILDLDTNGSNVASDFECSNFARMSATSEQVFNHENAGHPSPQHQVQVQHRRTTAIPPSARSQALKVLNKIPHVAEKRSRMLVPILLRWAGSTEIDADSDAIGSQRWNRADQKAMLSVFAQFTNPKVLYKQAEVHASLLNLCSNGDAEIQRSALKAICAWKEPAIVKYEDHLTNLLDESRFRDELSVFLQDPSDDEATVQATDFPCLMPVLLRLVYGRAVAGGKQGQGSRRRAIFVALSRHGEGVLKLFVEIALGSLASMNTIQESTLDQQLATLTATVHLRKQLGMVNMFEDMLETLGSELEAFGEQLLKTIMLVTISASRKLNLVREIDDASLLRSIRQAGIQCLVHMFTAFTDTDFLGYAQLALRQIVCLRLDKLPLENTQSVSGILKLISAWSGSSILAQCLIQEPMLLPKVAELLSEPTAKDEVRIFVLQNILANILGDALDSLLPSTDVREFTASIGKVLDQQPSKPVLDACVDLLTQLSHRINNRSDAVRILAVCADLLTRPGMIVSPTTKVGLLRTLSPLLDNFDTDVDEALYSAVSGLFSRLNGQDNRILLCTILVKLCRRDSQLLQSAEICADINAVGAGLQDVDHDRRERGFSRIYEQASAFTTAQWQPIVQNCLFYIRDAEDMVNRSSTSQALQRFITAAAADETCKSLLSSTLLPGIERGMKAESELVRSEYLQLLGHVVTSFPQWPAVSDMTVLLVEGDDEASIFVNVLHIQHHRRLRALRRLADEATAISSSNTVKYFLPLLEHFVFDQVEGDAGRTLSDQTIQTLGALAKSLNWPAFRATFKRYVGYLSSKEDHEKPVLRLLGTFVDALVRGDISDEKEAKRSEIIIRDFLPPLTDYVHHKDESTIDRRMPVAITIVKLLLLLPETVMTARLAPVLSDVCHVLRSRSQEARDQTRKTLASISSLVGSAYLGFILKSLRSALQRGYQLHVLSFTVHSLLINAAETCEPGDLDYCVPEVVGVVLDDIFGVTGQEKDAEEYKSGMKEVKSSKSFDTMELLARITPVSKLGLLVKPLRDLLSEKLDSRMLKKIDDLLTRLRKGLDQNAAADSRDMLVFCHEIVRQVHDEQQAAANPAKKAADRRTNRYLIQMESANKSKSKGAITSQLFKLASFSLNLLRKVLRRHEDLMTPGNMAGFLPIAGDALVQGQEDVQTASVKLLSNVMKLPMGALDANAPVYVNESVRLIKGANSVTTESAKAALELVTAVLREKRSVTIKERDIGEVLKCLKADIDEPDRQGIIYKFLRAVLGRRIMIKEVYELMDEVGKVVVTNPDRNVRESARSAYLQFVMEYPQGRDRWNKQAAFFVENLKYDRPNGRQSVMELLNQVLGKVGDDVFKQLAFTFFVALVPVLANDEDRSCRQMAGILIGKLIERADEEQYELYMKLVEKWLMNEENQAIMIASLRCWMVILRTRAPEKLRIEALRDRLESLITDVDNIGEESSDGQIMTALQTAEVLMETRPDVAYSPSQDGTDICTPLAGLLTVVHIETRELTAKLLGAFLSHIASSSAKTGEGLAALPLQGAYGLALDDNDLRRMCTRTLAVLRSSGTQLNDAIISHNTRNLGFVGRCFVANGMAWKLESDSDSEEIDGDAEVAEAAEDRDPSAIAYLLNRLSYIIRQERFPAISRSGAVQTQAALLPHLPKQVPNLDALIRPLYLLTDPSIPQPPGEAHRALVDAARELLDAVQKKVGSEAYVSALGVARREVKQKREERRQKRRIDAVSRPERWAKEKQRKVEGKKAKKREKGIEYRGKRRGW